MDLGNRLYELRKAKKISQEEAAEKLNVTRQTISKWETNQSQPDFDKIMPLCELYEIGVEELFGNQKMNIGEKKQEEVVEQTDYKKKTALVVSTSVFFYFIAVIWIILASSFSWLNDVVMISIFLLICAIATVLLVYHFLSIPKKENTEEKRKQKEIEKYDGVIAIFFTCIYLLLSFLTRAWHITWLLWIVYALIIEILHLILGTKEDKNEE